MSKRPQDMPSGPVRDYDEIRKYIQPGMVAFFSGNTDGWKSVTNYVEWRIKNLQHPPHECTHVGLIDVVHGRRVLIEAVPPAVRLSPLSASLGHVLCPDGRFTRKYDGRVYIGEFDGCNGEAAADRAWENLLLPYDYKDIAAMRLGKERMDSSRYICSELVSDALSAGGVLLNKPHRGWVYTPADLILDKKCTVLWRVK